MTNVILQGGTPFDKTVAGVAALDILWTVKQSLTHVHFAWFNGTNADGSWKPLPLAHPPANEPYFPLSIADASWKTGQLLLLTWGSHNLNVGGKKVRVETVDLLAHKYDPYLIAQAHTLRDWKHPIVIALNAEFNYHGSAWYLDPLDFVTLWHYVVDLFRREGATNASWAWIANNLSRGEDLAPFFPGTDYVDFTGFDAYNWASSRNAPWITFTEMLTGTGAATWLGNTYGTLEQLAPTTPMIVGEFGCHTTPGNKAAWLKDALTVIPRDFPLISAISYYPIGDGSPHWALDVTDGTLQAWVDGLLRGSYVVGSQFTMPPDLQPLQPFTRFTQAGDPLKQLQAATARIDVLTKEITDYEDDLNDAHAALEQATKDLEQTRSDARAAQITVDQAKQAAAMLVKLGSAA